MRAARRAAACRGPTTQPVGPDVLGAGLGEAATAGPGLDPPSPAVDAGPPDAPPLPSPAVASLAADPEAGAIAPEVGRDEA